MALGLNNGLTSYPARWLEGSPKQVRVARGWRDSDVIRQWKFGRTEGGRFASAFDAWGNPLAIEEVVPAWNQQLEMNDFPALTQASGPWGTQSFSWPASGDRHEADGQPYCYQRGTHRLASVGATTYRWREDGSIARRESPDGAALTFCYDGQGRVASTVGAGGDVNRLVTNFRRQRVAEVWPVNGLREDFMVDEASRLLSEEGVASLSSQYPRPVREYVWLGAHPVAVLEASEEATGLVTSRGVTFVHSGHLGEVLSETDEGGHVVRQSLVTPFGERVEVSSPAVPLEAETPNPYSSYSTEVSVAGVRALKLHFTEVELASCDAIVVTDGSGGPEVARVPSTSSGEVWTEWLPTSSASVTLRAAGCGQARGFRLVEALPQWGAVHVEARGESTANPYPADGQRFQVSLGTGGYVKLTNVTVASCDEVEARAPTGEVLWRWKPAAAWAKAWSGRMSGDVEVGIWGEGCNATERKGGFTLAEVRLEEAASAPLPLGLPGQKQRPDGTWDNWHRTYMAELGRYLAPEPLQQSPAYVMSMSAGGMQTQAYAYAANSPLRYVDSDGLKVNLAGIRGNSKWSAAAGASTRLSLCPIITKYFEKCFGTNPWTNNSEYEFVSATGRGPRDSDATTNLWTNTTTLYSEAFGTNTVYGEAELGATIAHELSHHVSLSTFDGQVYFGAPQPTGPCTANAFERLARCILTKGCKACSAEQCEQPTGVVFGPEMYR